MLPHGVIEDTKGEDNVSEDAANLKRKKTKDGNDIEKGSYFRDSFEDDNDNRSEKDLFNSSLGGWDMHDEASRRRKRPPK